MDTYTRVREAFYSGGYEFTGDRQTIKDIAFLVDEHYLSLTLFPIADHKEYTEMLYNLTQNKHADEAAGGSSEHVALKLLSGAYLQIAHDRQIWYEHSLCGHYPDVMTTDGQIVVECGHTHNPEKMLTYFKQSDIRECICVPYPDPDEQKVFGYSFSASDTLRDFLAFWDAEKFLEIRKLKERS